MAREPLQAIETGKNGSPSGAFFSTPTVSRDDIGDISDRKQSDEMRHQLSAIVESSDDAILGKDLNGIIQSWNQGAERLFGYTAAETIGKPITVLMPEGRQNEEPDILSRIKRGERIDHYETIRQRKDGGLVHISLSVSPIKNQSGVVVGAAKIARDITERKESEAALKQARDELALLNETLEKRVEERTAALNGAVLQMQEFSYSVSHDLRAPIRAMQAYARAIMEDHSAELSAEALEYLQRIFRGSTRMDKLIHDVLIYSRLAQDQIECKPVALAPLIQDILLQYPEMQSPHTEIRVRLPIFDVMANESLLTQAISNLLNNSKKFMGEGVTPKIEIWTERRGSLTRLWIKDNGIGIHPEHHGRLFGMFERVHADGKYEGTGIGLAIVRKAVEKMGGKVGLESDGISGSSFWIELNSPPESGSFV